MPSISIPTGAALLGSAAVSGAAALGGAVLQGNAAKSAADTQAQAANNAEAATMAQFNKTQQNLAPFISGGTNALTALQSLTGTGAGGNPLTAPLTKPFAPTEAQLEQTPGYQFTKQQGLLATQNGYAAQGLGSSGAAAKGAANYAEGLASTTYQQQFQNYLAQNQQIYSMLGGLTTVGQNAAAMTGTQGLTATGQAGQFGTAGAAASAAGQVGAANAGANALTGVANSGSNAALLLALNNGGLFSGGANGT